MLDFVTEVCSAGSAPVKRHFTRANLYGSQAFVEHLP